MQPAEPGTDTLGVETRHLKSKTIRTIPAINKRTEKIGKRYW